MSYCAERASAEDLDALSFSLHHMFCHIDVLYRLVIPELISVSPSPIPDKARLDGLLRHQHIWSKLISLKHILNRIEPLCSLMSDASESILAMFDLTNGTQNIAPTFEKSAQAQVEGNTGGDWLHLASLPCGEHDYEAWEIFGIGAQAVEHP